LAFVFFVFTTIQYKLNAEHEKRSIESTERKYFDFAKWRDDHLVKVEINHKKKEKKFLARHERNCFAAASDAFRMPSKRFIGFVINI
jgi:hypothetical protein